MTITSELLAPIRPNNGEVGDNMHEEGDGAAEEAMGEDKERAEAEEELRKPKPAARPQTPTKEEVHEHEVTHLPYRSWCKHCLRGRGVSAPHPTRTSRRKSE